MKASKTIDFLFTSKSMFSHDEAREIKSRRGRRGRS
jgi:hypothetical protein